MSESPRQSRKNTGFMALFAGLMMAGNPMSHLGSSGLRGSFHGSGEYIPRRGPFKGHHREYRRSQFKRTHQKR